MASGFHNPYAGSSIDAHLLGMQQTEEQAAQRRQQAGQNQQAMGLAQQQMAADQAQTQQAMGMQQQRMAHEYGMQQQAFGQAMQMSQMEAQQRTMRDKLMLDAQRQLSQEAQQFQLRREALELQMMEAEITGKREVLEKAKLEAMSLKEKQAELATQIGMLGVLGEKTESEAASVIESLKKEMNQVATATQETQNRVVNSAPAIRTAIQERDLNRSRSAVSQIPTSGEVSGFLSGWNRLQQEGIAPNLMQEFSGVPGAQYLEFVDEAPTGLQLAGAALSPFETRTGLYVRGPMSAEKLRDTVKQEMIEDIRESVGQLGAKVNDDAAFTSAISMMLEGDGPGGIKKLIDSGVDPLTIRYLVKVIKEFASDSTNSLQTQMNEAMARDPSSPQAKALQAAVSANAIRKELSRKVMSPLELQTTGVEEYKAMQSRIEKAITTRNYETLVAAGYGNVVKAMREKEIAESDILNAKTRGSDLELRRQELEYDMGLDSADVQLNALGVYRAGLKDLEGLFGETR